MTFGGFITAAAVFMVAFEVPSSGQQPAARGRATPPQPQQRQGVEYLAGTWNFTWTGRESPITAGPRTGTLTFSRIRDTNILTMETRGKVEDTGTAFTERGSAEWNDAQKTLAVKETLANLVEMSGVGDWSSPLSIRYESQPVNIGRVSIRIRRVYAILSAQSFSVTEEMSVDGGPFQRLGNGLFTKADK
jgi:hypothetical protein